jgi:hypothetical protein
MKFEFEILEVGRKNFSGLMRNLSIEQMNHTPEGFNNNIIWNYGHVVVTQQLLHYGLSGLPIKMDKAIVDKYRKGAKPTDFIDMEEFKMLKNASIELLQQTFKDYENGVFESFKVYPTSFGITLNNIDDAIHFNNVHENIHLGSIMALKKLV